MRKILVMPAGGEGSRISNLTGDKIHKSCLKVGDHSLLYYSIKFWKEVDQIILLLRERYDSVIELLKTEEFDAIRDKISVVIELEKLGKGGALLNALKNRNIHDDDIIIIHNPDDIVLNENSESLIAQHKSMRASISVIGVEYTFSPYTGLKYNDKNNKIDFVQPNFKINEPCHIGITFLSGAFMNHKLNSESKKVFDFENEWFYEESKNQTMLFLPIDFENWFPVNDIKGFNKLRSQFS